MADGGPLVLSYASWNPIQLHHQAYRRAMIVVGLVTLDHGGKRLSWIWGCKVQWYIYRILALPYMAAIWRLGGCDLLNQQSHKFFKFFLIVLPSSLMSISLQVLLQMWFCNHSYLLFTVDFLVVPWLSMGGSISSSENWYRSSSRNNRNNEIWPTPLHT